MQILKALGMGTLFLALIFVAHIVIGAVIGKVQVQHGTAAGLSALKVGTIYNPYFWLTVVVAYGSAVWIVKR